MAEEENVAVLLIRHPTKNRDHGPLEAGSGSIGISASARAVFYLGQDPDNERTVVLAPVKQNLSESVSSLCFRIGSSKGSPRIEWLGVSEKSASDLRPQVIVEQVSKLEEARKFLVKILANGPLLETEIAEMASVEGISMKTLRRAKKEEKVESVKDGFGSGERWRWRLLRTVSNANVPPLAIYGDAMPEYQCGGEVAKMVKDTIPAPANNGTPSTEEAA